MGLCPEWHLLLGQSSGEGKMKPEFFEVTIAPLGQKRLFCRGTEVVKFVHTIMGDVLQAIHLPSRRQRQKSAQQCQLKAVADRRCQRSGHGRKALFQAADGLTVFQAKGRLQRTVNTIFARCHCDVMQKRQDKLKYSSSPSNIPTQPGCAKIGEVAIGRHVIYRKASV